MVDLSPKERLLKALRGEEVDRPPVICPGGMMNAAIVDVMNKTGHTLPEAHTNPSLMAALAQDVNSETGFENLGIPFCMTVEAEILGSKVNLGTLECEPKIDHEIFADSQSADFTHTVNGRIRTVVGAASELSQTNDDIPVVGNLTGPISTAASVVDPVAFLKGLRKDPENSHRVLEYVTDFLAEYAKQLISAGASAISIGDPTATGEILGPKAFEEYAVRYLSKLVNAIQTAGAPVIVHICGDIRSVKHLLQHIGSDVISTDGKPCLFERRIPRIKSYGKYKHIYA
jgi:[methyl-Co(III) methanol-specific corrinoid protein]:coenzyme M methyltransferase